MGADSRSSIIYEELVDTREKLEWIRRFDEWTPADVAAWLRRRQFDKYAEQFVAHRITGRHLMRLEEKHLIEMTEGGWLGGAMPVGDRIRLLQEIQRVAIKYQNALRFETKWEAHAPRFTDGPRDFLKQWLLCMPLYAEVDHYRLTANSFTVRHYAPGLCCGLFGANTHERHVDLSNIAMVNVFEQSMCCTCGCEAERIEVHLDGALDLEELPLVKVPSGQAKAVADIILRQMEIVQAPDKAAAPEAAPAEGEMVR